MNDAEHNPDGLTPEQYGAPEWRLLRKGEKLLRTDELQCENGTWAQLVHDGHLMLATYTYRRRVSPTLAVNFME